MHSDGHNGSVRAITDASGAVVAHYEFDAWGAQLGSSSPFSGGFSFGYVGSLGVRTDATTGLIWMRHRWFDPNGLQRFISRDLLNSANRYEYCYSKPIELVDVSGLDPSHPDPNLALQDIHGIVPLASLWNQREYDQFQDAINLISEVDYATASEIASKFRQGRIVPMMGIEHWLTSGAPGATVFWEGRIVLWRGATTDPCLETSSLAKRNEHLVYLAGLLVHEHGHLDQSLLLFKWMWSPMSSGPRELQSNIAEGQFYKKILERYSVNTATGRSAHRNYLNTQRNINSLRNTGRYPGGGW